MDRAILRGILAIAVLAVAATPMAAPAGPKVIRVNSDGSSYKVKPAKPAKPAKQKNPIAVAAKAKGKTTSTSTATTVAVSTSTAGAATPTASPAPAPAAPEPVAPVQVADYLPTLNPTYTPGELNWAGRKWRVNSGATKFRNMPHSVQLSQSGARMRVEIRPGDTPAESNKQTRRAEFSGSIYGDKTRLPNGTVLWGAFSTIHHPWADPKGMTKTYGGVHGQIHMGSKVGGSPALAFRRHQSGRLRITTRGEFNDGGTHRYEGELLFGVPHDIVYRVVLHPTRGALTVWINGAKVVDVANVSIGHSAADHYWALGAYYSGNVTCPVVAEYANHVYPASASLQTRVSRRPTWPST